MAQKILKIRSNESGNFQAGSLVSIEIPQTLGFVDLKSSYILLEGVTLKESTTGANNTAVDNPNTMCYLPAGGISLINQLRLEADKTGVIEEIISADVLGTNLFQLKYNEDDKNNMAKLYGAGTYPLSQNLPVQNYYQKTSLFSNPTVNANTGVTAGAKRSIDVIVPLSMVLSLDELPCALVGNSTLRLNFSNSSMNNVLPIAPLVAGRIDGQLNANGTVFTTNNNYNFTAAANTSEVPFYNNQIITCYDNTTAVISRVNCGVVTVAGGKMVLTRQTAFPAGTVSVAYNIPDFKFSWECEGVQLVVYQNILPFNETKQLQDKLSKGVAYPFSTYKVDIESTNSTSGYSHTYMLEPNTIGVIGFIPPTVDQQLSTKATPLNSYRLSVDNVDLVEREIYINDSLNNDRVVQTFKAIGEPLQSLYYQRNNYYSGTSNDKLVIASPITPSEKMKKLSIVGDGNVANKNVFLYKKVMKELQIRGGMAMVV